MLFVLSAKSYYVPLIRWSPPCIVNTGENRVNKPSDQAQAPPPPLSAPPSHHHPHQNSWRVELCSEGFDYKVGGDGQTEDGLLVVVVVLLKMGSESVCDERQCLQRSRPLQTKESIVLLDGNGNLGNEDDKRKLKVR